MCESFCESIIDDLRVRDKLGIRAASDIIDYTSENPYKLVWRYDFDETLISVCNINGEDYDKDNLSDEDLDVIESEYGYLRNTASFIKNSGLNFCRKDTKVIDDASSYIDYINEGWPNPDGKTYSYREYLLTEKGNRLDLCSGSNAPLSDDGYFAFDDVEMPCRTRTLEDGVEVYDFR